MVSAKSVTASVLIAIFLTIVSIQALIGIRSYIEEKRTLQQHFENLTLSTANTVTKGLKYSFWNVNRAEMTEWLTVNADTREIRAIKVYDHKGNFFMGFFRDETWRPQFADSETAPALRLQSADIKIDSPITYNELVLGKTSILFTERFNQQALTEALTYMLIQSLALAVVTILILYVALSRLVIRPVLRLNQSLIGFTENGFIRAEPMLHERQDEIGTLFRTSSLMTQQLTEAVKKEKETAQLLSTMFDTMPDAICILDMDYNVIRSNYAFDSGFFNCSVIVDRERTDKTNENSVRCEFDIVADVYNTSHHQEREVVDDDRQTCMEQKAYPILDDDGKLVQVLLHIRDVTEERRKARERKRLEMEIQQSQRLESIGTLAGGVAHEINNPINGIMNYAQLIKDKSSGSSETADFAAEIIHETDRVSNIVRNLLTFARQDREGHSPARLIDIFEGTSALIQTIFKRDQITLEMNIAGDLPKIKCSSQQIQQVLMNLFTNARDALNEKFPEYHMDKKVSVTSALFVTENRQWIRTTVTDNGIGIPQEIVKTIFDPFFTTKSKVVGTGLGLSISFGIVKDHHGELSVVSKPGQYTTFHMDLPVDNGWEL